MSSDIKLPEVKEKTKENRKNQAQNITAKKLEPYQRQKIVHSLDIQGFSNKEIAQQVGVSVSTVEKDLNEMHRNIRGWFSDLGREERYLVFVDAVIQLDVVTKELWKLIRDTNDQKDKSKLFEQILNTVTKKTELFKSSESYLTSYYFKQDDLSTDVLLGNALKNPFKFPL